MVGGRWASWRLNHSGKDLSVTSLRKKYRTSAVFHERFHLPRPSIPPRTHISPADTLSADLFSCTEGQSSSLCKKI